MKKAYSLVIAAAVIAWAVPSFALVDVEGYGGLTLGGDYKASAGGGGSSRCGTFVGYTISSAGCGGASDHAPRACGFFFARNR